MQWFLPPSFSNAAAHVLHGYGFQIMNPTFPFVPGMDICGVVEEISETSDMFKVRLTPAGCVACRIDFFHISKIRSTYRNIIPGTSIYRNPLYRNVIHGTLICRNNLIRYIEISKSDMSKYHTWYFDMSNYHTSLNSIFGIGRAFLSSIPWRWRKLLDMSTYRNRVELD